MPRIYTTELKRLKQEIEEKLGLTREKPGHIARKVGEKLDEISKGGISSATLNRIWYNNCSKEECIGFEDATINTLLKILGYKNWEEYKKYLNQENNNKITIENPANTFYEVDIDISRLEQGEEIVIGYTNKYAKLRYIDGFEFEVLESHNTRKKTGERFITPGFSTIISGSGEVNIMLDDYGDGYFDYQTEEYGEVFDDDYFYL
ncbi:hypothetical protein [Bacteroides sp. 224]|uniref:hypothetical protein n=1 Tax=Bacteroides sp. 224 TaxID=2302936 RepID=UPI0013CF4F90|nr:hypothetical protein [Bacteroides sp. 224]NDV66406.1 hypothetical protein [Bacteroides sp. 224]